MASDDAPFRQRAMSCLHPYHRTGAGSQVTIVEHGPVVLRGVEVEVLLARSWAPGLASRPWGHEDGAAIETTTAASAPPAAVASWEWRAGGTGMDRGLPHRRCIRAGRPTGIPTLTPADPAHCHTLDPVTQRRPAPRICTSPRPPPRPPAPMWPSTMFMGAMITGGMAPPAPGIISPGTSMPGPPGPMTMPWSKTIWPPSGPCRPPPRGLDTRGGGQTVEEACTGIVSRHQNLGAQTCCVLPIPDG